MVKFLTFVDKFAFLINSSLNYDSALFYDLRLSCWFSVHVKKSNLNVSLALIENTSEGSFKILCSEYICFDHDSRSA